MLWPYIKLTQEYSDENNNKQERPINLLPELIEYFSHFEIGYNGSTFCVKEDIKTIESRIKSKIKDIEKGDKEDFT